MNAATHLLSFAGWQLGKHPSLWTAGAREAAYCCAVSAAKPVRIVAALPETQRAAVEGATRSCMLRTQLAQMLEAGAKAGLTAAHAAASEQQQQR